MVRDLNYIWLELNDYLHHFVKKKVGDSDAVNDIVQEVYLKIQTSLHLLKNEEKLIPWVFAITRNAITDHFRSNSKKVDAGIMPQMVADQNPVQDETGKFSQCIIPMINTLPGKYKEALEMSEIESISQKEIAERLSISYSAVKSRVQRGREKLKDVLLQCCEIKTDKYGNIIEYHERNKSGKRY